MNVTKNLQDNLSSTSLFLQELLLYPQQIGALLPSSRRLANKMAAWLPADPDAFVLELGPGTGVVTDAILRRGLPQERLITIEKSARMVKHLQERFPKAHVIHGDACNLDKVIRKHLGIDTVGAVISSLPLRVFSPEAAKGLAQKIRSALHPEGRWVQYSYYLGTGRPEATVRFDLISSHMVWLNLPPARVNVYQRKRSAHDEKQAA